MRKDNFLCESCGIVEESGLFLLTSEVVEETLEKYAEFRTMHAVNKLLVLSPCDRAEVTKLAKTLLRKNTVMGHALHDTGALKAMLFDLEEEVSCEAKSGLHNALNSFQSP